MPYSVVSGVVDAQDPRAQAYARMALRKNGINVPPHADAAKAWREFSQMRARAWATARAAGPDPPDYPQPQGQDIQGSSSCGQEETMKKKLPPLKAKGVDPGEMLGEGIAEGLTLGPESEEEAREKFPSLPGAPDLSYLAREGGVKFRALEKPSDPFYIGFPDGRLLRDVDVAFSADDRKKIEQGYICIRCLEPQSAMNADDHLPGCIGVAHYGERYMRDGHHLVDVAAEFDERKVHVGPARPLRAYLDEQDELAEKKRFERKLNGG